MFGAKVHLVTTEKDAVKVPEMPKSVVHERSPLPIYVVSVEVTFQDGDAEFQALNKQRLAEKIRKDGVKP